MEEYTKKSVSPEESVLPAATDTEAPCGSCASGCGGCRAQIADEPAQEAVCAESQPQNAEAQTVVVDVHFRNNAKTYFFDPGALRLKAGDHVIMDTSRGIEYGICAAGNHPVASSLIVPPLRKILRLANTQDERVNAENLEKEKRAFSICLQKIEEHRLEMQLVSAECAFDGSKLLFFFTADGRVDFRELVKDLASIFRTRIELRQIGVRDKAKMVGGLGMCGRPFCCREFLDDFQPVSIKMAKTQSLSLNPTKISGVCGRLMCCLKYEQDAYEDLLRTAPKNESFVDTPDGRGTVTEVNLLRQSVKVRMEDHPETIGSYKNEEICVLRSGKARKNDPPIPKDLAPISSRPRPVRKPLDEFEPLPDVIYPDDIAVPERAPQPAEPQPADESAASEKKPHRRRNRHGKGGAKPAEATSAPEAKPQSKPRPALKNEAATAEKPADGEQTPSANRRRRRYRGHRGGSAPKSES